MVTLETALRLVGGVVLLFANGFFVTTEFAMTRVRQFPKSEFVGQGRGLELAWEMTERLEIYLSGCQVGITVSSVGLGVVAEPAVAAAIAPLLGAVGLGATGGGHAAVSVLVALAIINLLHVIVGEQAPTYLGVERAKLVANYGAPLLYGWTKLMSPVIVVADRISKGLLGLFGVTISRAWAEEEVEGEESEGPPTSPGELRRQMGDTLARAGVTGERREEVINALEIGDMPVAEVMNDREDIVALSTADDFETNLERMQTTPHVRFPLVGDELEEFHGIVYTPHILRNVEAVPDGDVDLREVAAPPMTVSATTTVSDAIDQLQAESQELALVIENGRVVGLVTATDAFEAIAGDLEDPFDVEARRRATTG